MSSPLTVKRRRVNDATQKLAKPFVSPMRSAKPAERQPFADVANTRYTPSTLAHTIKRPYDSVDYVSTDTTVRRPTRFMPLRRHPVTANRRDPAEIAAQKALTALELQIRKVKNDLDVLKQSEQIKSSTMDAELEALADKWRLASQQAAEELFGVVKERVCRMGGVQAWRESEKRKFERANGLGEFVQQADVEEDDDADCEFDSQGEELPEEEAEWRKREKRRMREEAREAMDPPEAREAEVEGGDAGETRVWQDDGKDDDVSISLWTQHVSSTNLPTDVYDGHDATFTEHRAGEDRVRQAVPALDLDLRSTVNEIVMVFKSLSCGYTPCSVVTPTCSPYT